MQWRWIIQIVVSSSVVIATSLFSSPSVSAQELRPVAAAITVRIDAPGDGDGSGVIIAQEGNTYLVLTAWHVVSEPGQYAIYTLDSREHIVDHNQVERLSTFDLAVVRFNSYNHYELASIGNSDSIGAGQSISVSGWVNPLIELSRTTYQFISGTVTGFAAPPEEGGYSLVFSTPGAFQGMSGGPVLNDQNQVIGIIGRAARAIGTGQVGLYLGIPVNVFTNSSYGQSIQSIQLSSPTQRSPNTYYPPQEPPPQITSPDAIYFPEQNDPPQISNP